VQTYDATVEVEGVTIIVGDLQLNPHRTDEFGNRASIGFNPYADAYVRDFSDAYYTSESHATFVSSLAAGNRCGLAKKATIVGVTLLDDTSEFGNRASTGVMAGYSWIIDYIEDKKAEHAPKSFPVVCNFSIGSSTNVRSTAEDNAIAAIIEDGAMVVIAAGNSNWLHNHSPFSSAAILVGATNEAIVPTDFSDWGPNISLWAPGADIMGASYLPLVFERGQGTSYSAPYVTGLCALFLGLYPEATPAEVKEAILLNAREFVTYNKDYSTFLFAQNPVDNFIPRGTVNTAEVHEDEVYAVTPYVVGFDGERIYAERLELTTNPIASAVVSAGRSESSNLATIIRLAQ
jgi:subtilisin family serine protease